MKAIDNLTDMSSEQRERLQRLLWLYTMGMHETLSICGHDSIKNTWATLKSGFFVYSRDLKTLDI